MIKFIAGFCFALLTMLTYSAVSQDTTTTNSLLLGTVINTVMRTALTPSKMPSVIMVDENGYVICSDTKK